MPRGKVRTLNGELMAFFQARVYDEQPPDVRIHIWDNM